jgi:hypothetical protein
MMTLKKQRRSIAFVVKMTTRLYECTWWGFGVVSPIDVVWGPSLGAFNLGSRFATWDGVDSRRLLTVRITNLLPPEYADTPSTATTNFGSRLDRPASTIPDPFISTCLFNPFHSLNPFFHLHSSIRNATDFTDVNQALRLYLYPDEPSPSYNISSPCTFLIISIIE